MKFLNKDIRLKDLIKYELQIKELTKNENEFIKENKDDNTIRYKKLLEHRNG